MALEGTSDNIYGYRALGDLTLVLIVLGAGSGQAALAAGSTQDITVATPGAGVYNITFPKGTTAFVLSDAGVNQTTVKGAVTGLSLAAATGVVTVTLSDGNDLSGSEQFHLAILCGGA